MDLRKFVDNILIKISIWLAVRSRTCN